MNIDPEVQRRAQVLQALGDPVRLAVVEHLRLQDLSPDRLAAALDVPGNLLAHHLKVLESAGVIERTHSQHDRRRTYVRLLDDSLDGLLPGPEALAVPRVVFVCTHNSARSVLAEALWRQVSDVPSASAGTYPAERINPRARSAARRAGLDLDSAAPRSIDAVITDDDLLVSVCDSVNEELGPRPNPRLHWSVPDPSPAGTDAAFAAAVDDLRERVNHLAPRVQYRRHSTSRRAAR